MRNDHVTLRSTAVFDLLAPRTPAVPVKVELRYDSRRADSSAARRWGTRPFAELAAPAVRLAREGALVNREQAYINEILAGINATTDGGRHWYDLIGPFPSVPNGETLDSAGDPALTVAPAVPPRVTSPVVKPVTASLKTAAKLMGEALVGSAWPAASRPPTAT